MKYFISFIFIVATFGSLAYGQRNPSLIEAKRIHNSSYEIHDDTSESTRSEQIPPELNRGTVSPAIPSANDSPLKILRKPPAHFPNGAFCVQGSVLLKIEFLANGNIGRVMIVRGLPHGLNESSIDAARKIVFIPEFRNGQYVTVIRTTDYPFYY